MNLRQMIDRIHNLTDYSPEVNSYNFQIADLINDAYFDLWTHKRWTFATEEQYLDIHTDMTSTTDTEQSGGNPVLVNTNNGSRNVSFNWPMSRLEMSDVWEGQPIELAGREYIINKIYSSTQLLLTEPFEHTSNLKNSSDWIIKKRWYDLPENCAELLYVGHNDVPFTGQQPPWGKAEGLLPRRREDWNLRIDWTNDYAEFYIPAPCDEIEPAQLLTLTDVGTGGDIQSGYYQFAWCFEKDGKLGALSKPDTVQVVENGSSITLQFKGYDDLPINCDGVITDPIPSQWEGYRKRIFFNYNIDRTSGEETGNPIWLEVTNGGPVRNDAWTAPVVVQDTFSTYTIQYLNQMKNGNKRYIERDGQHQKIMFYPRPIGFDQKVEITDETTRYNRKMLMRYYRKPQNMLLLTDSPDMPVEFHKQIVYKTLEQVYAKLGQQGLSAKYEKQMMRDIKELAKRYTDKIDFKVQRGQFDGAGIYQGRFDSQSLRKLN